MRTVVKGHSTKKVEKNCSRRASGIALEIKLMSKKSYSRITHIMIWEKPKGPSKYELFKNYGACARAHTHTK